MSVSAAPAGQRAAHERLRVLMVCMGNICRSPLAQGLLEKRLREEGLASKVEVDSAGTGAWHAGEPPDNRGRRTAEARGFDISRQRARELAPEDFERFDLILCMDERNRREVLARCPPERHKRVRLLLDFAPELTQREVPDPYYDQLSGFERVADMIELAVDGLMEHLHERLQSP